MDNWRRIAFRLIIIQILLGDINGINRHWKRCTDIQIQNWGSTKTNTGLHVFWRRWTTKVQDPERLKALTAEITRLEEQLDHSSQILAKGSTLLGERKVADIETSKVYAQNRIIGIRAKVWHGLMEMLVPKIEIEQSIRGDLIFIQAGKDLVSRVLNLLSSKSWRQKPSPRWRPGKKLSPIVLNCLNHSRLYYKISSLQKQRSSNHPRLILMSTGSANRLSLWWALASQIRLHRQGTGATESSGPSRTYGADYLGSQVAGGQSGLFAFCQLRRSWTHLTRAGWSIWEWGPNRLEDHKRRPDRGSRQELIQLPTFLGGIQTKKHDHPRHFTRSKGRPELYVRKGMLYGTTTATTQTRRSRWEREDLSVLSAKIRRLRKSTRRYSTIRNSLISRVNSRFLMMLFKDIAISA